MWASSVAACAEPDQGVILSADRIEMPADKRSCAITSIKEDHPTGRSMTYTVGAACNTNGQASTDIFHFAFGASDTVMQFQINDAAPLPLERCPSVETP